MYHTVPPRILCQKGAGGHDFGQQRSETSGTATQRASVTAGAAELSVVVGPTVARGLSLARL